MYFLTLQSTIILIVVVRTSRGSPKDIVCAYSKHQLLSHCYGEKAAKNIFNKLKEASKECQTFHPTFHAVEDQRMTPNGRDYQVDSGSKSFFAKQNPWFSNFNWEELFDSSKSISIGDKREIKPADSVPHLNNSFFSGKKKRELEHNQFSAEEETVRERKNLLTQKISNLTCVLRKLKYMGEQNQLEYNYMVLETRSLVYPPPLQEDIIEGMKQCKESIPYQPVDGISPTLLPASLKHVMAFLKCVEQKRLTTCIKYSFHRQNQRMVFLEGLDLVMADIEGEDELFAIISGDNYTKY